MPVYKILSEKELNLWRSHLHGILQEVINSLDVSNLSYLIIEIFEYAQVSMFYQNNKSVENCGVFENVKITIKDLKNVADSENISYLINSFKSTADNLRHTGYNADTLKGFLGILIQEKEDVKIICEKLFENVPFISEFLCSNRLSCVYREVLI